MTLGLHWSPIVRDERSAYSTWAQCATLCVGESHDHFLDVVQDRFRVGDVPGGTLPRYFGPRMTNTWHWGLF